MASAKFKPYQHGKSGYAQRKTAAEWEARKSMLTNLYKEGVSRNEMKSLLQADGFSVSMGQLVGQMMKWGFCPKEKLDVVARGDSTLKSEDSEQFLSSERVSDAKEIGSSLNKHLDFPNGGLDEDNHIVNIPSNLRLRDHREKLQIKNSWVKESVFHETACSCWILVDRFTFNRFRGRRLAETLTAHIWYHYWPHDSASINLLQILLLETWAIECNRKKADFLAGLNDVATACVNLLHRPGVRNDIAFAVLKRFIAGQAFEHLPQDLKHKMTSCVKLHRLDYWNVDDLNAQLRLLDIKTDLGVDDEVSVMSQASQVSFIISCTSFLHAAVKNLAASIMFSLETNAKRHFDHVDLAARISEFMISEIYQRQASLEGTSDEILELRCMFDLLRDSRRCVPFDAMALLVASGVHTTVKWADEKAFSKALDKAIIDMTPTQEDVHLSLDRWTNMFSHACWLVDPEKSMFDSEAFHSGTCNFEGFWHILHQDICTFDKQVDGYLPPTTISSSPQNVACENAVRPFDLMISEGEAYAFTRPIVICNRPRALRAKFLNAPSWSLLADEDKIFPAVDIWKLVADEFNEPFFKRAKIHAPPPVSESARADAISFTYRLPSFEYVSGNMDGAESVISSNRSCWSGHMSVQSWKLEYMLGIEQLPKPVPNTAMATSLLYSLQERS